jgi:hypothetical protein
LDGNTDVFMHTPDNQNRDSNIQTTQQAHMHTRMHICTHACTHIHGYAHTLITHVHMQAFVSLGNKLIFKFVRYCFTPLLQNSHFFVTPTVHFYSIVLLALLAQMACMLVSEWE